MSFSSHLPWFVFLVRSRFVGFEEWPSYRKVFRDVGSWREQWSLVTNETTKRDMIKDRTQFQSIEMTISSRKSVYRNMNAICPEEQKKPKTETIWISQVSCRRGQRQMEEHNTRCVENPEGKSTDIAHEWKQWFAKKESNDHRRQNKIL